MPRTKKITAKKTTSRRITQRVDAQVSRPKVTVEKPAQTTTVASRSPLSLANNWTNKVNFDQSRFNLILGALIVLVAAFLLVSFLHQNNPTTTANNQPQTLSSNTAPHGDVTKDNLPGQYTVKDGDTLYQIAQNYYGNGYAYPKIAEASKIADPNNITSGQILDIPKLDAATIASFKSPTDAANTPQTAPNTNPDNLGTGGPTNQTIWGEKITGNTYTVQPGDWLSKIAGRAYGNVYDYTKIAQANNITDPNSIEPGTILTIPR